MSTGPHTPPPPSPGRLRDVLLIGLAQSAILVGLIILTAGVPTW